MNASLLPRRSIAGLLAALATTTAFAQVAVSPSPGNLPQPGTTSPTGSVVDIDTSVPRVLDEQALEAAREAAEAAGRLVAVLNVPLQFEGLPVAVLKQEFARRVGTTPDQIRIEVYLSCHLAGNQDTTSSGGLKQFVFSETAEIPDSGNWQGTARLEIRDSEDAQVSWRRFLSRTDAETGFECNVILNKAGIDLRDEYLSGSYTSAFLGVLRNGEWTRLSRIWKGEPMADEGSVLVAAAGNKTEEKLIVASPTP